MSTEHVPAPGKADDSLYLRWLMVAVRRRAGLTQDDVAQYMGTTQGHVSELENGVRDGRASTWQKYARACGASLHFRVTTQDGEIIDSMADA